MKFYFILFLIFPGILASLDYNCPKDPPSLGSPPLYSENTKPIRLTCDMASTAGLENIPDSLFVTGNSPTNVHTQSADYSPPAIHNPNNNQNAYSPPNNNQNAYNPPNTNSCCNNAPPAQPYGNSDTFSTTSTEDADDADDIFKGSSSGNTLQFTKYTVSGILVLSMIMFI